MKELFPLKTFQQDAILKRLSELYENEVDLDSRLETVEDEVDDIKDGTTNLFENITDAQGHKRFIEGDINLHESASTDITKVYGKWSLSGSHLMIVLCLSIPDETVIPYTSTLAVINLPQWVKDKIVPIVDDTIIYGNADYYAVNLTKQSNYALLRKVNNDIFITHEGFTLNADRNCRIEFDLLIDN